MDFSGVQELQALGRHFTLGTLYNHYKHSIINSNEMMLWDQEDLKKHISMRPHRHTDVDLILSDSLEEKSSALSIDISLRASILFGLIKFEGSAEYFDDRKTSKRQSRVTVKYRATTHIKELSMFQLGNIRYPSVIDTGLATHVVTAILYGAQVFFVFDRDVPEDETHQEVHGNMAMIVNKMSQIAEEIKGGVKEMDPTIQKEMDKLPCTYHGDICPDKKPTTFQEALETYKSLPALLKDEGKAVPVKVFLLPLTALDSSAVKLVYQISIGIVKEVQRVLEDFSELEIRCNDALKTTTVQHFPDIKNKIVNFKEMCTKFKHKFQQSSGGKLSFIKEFKAQEAELADSLKDFYSTNNRLKCWMDSKEREIETVRSITETMKNRKIFPSLNHLKDQSEDPVLCFVFPSLGSKEPFLSALSDHLKGTKFEELHYTEKEQWFTSKDKVKDIKKKVKLFNDFAEANKNNEKIKFIAVASIGENNKGSAIHLYKDGNLDREHFEPPSKPETVILADLNYNSVALKVYPPRFGAKNITSYSVEYCVHGEEEWQQKITESISEDVIVKDLKPNIEYMFRCRAVTSVGVGPAHVVSDPIKTLPCSPSEKTVFDATWTAEETKTN